MLGMAFSIQPNSQKLFPRGIDPWLFAFPENRSEFNWDRLLGLLILLIPCTILYIQPNIHNFSIFHRQKTIRDLLIDSRNIRGVALIQAVLFYNVPF